MQGMRLRAIGVLGVALVALGGCVSTGSKADNAAERVASQPLKDVGALKVEPEALLKQAQKAPYSLAGIKTCTGFVREIHRLNAVLGPDVDDVDENGDPMAGRLAEAGAASIVNSLIPLRGLVREATGAAAADRRQRAAIVAGVARRAFLKGNARARGCKF